jgi:uncharacterized protein (TIRG00374 family)
MTAAAGVRLAVALALTAVVVWRADPSRVLASAAAGDWRWVWAALALVLADRALMAYRWMVLLRALTPGTRPPFPAVLRIFFVSTFIGSFLPTLGGDVYRAYSLSRLRVTGAESAASVLMDRALGVVSMVLVALLALAFVPHVMRLPGVLPTVLVAAAACVVAAAGVYSERVAALALAGTARLPVRSARTLAAGLLNAVRRYAGHHGEVTNVLGSSIGVQVLRILQAWCLGIALGIQAPPWAYFVFVPLIVIVMQIPVTTMGLGTSQLAFELFFAQVGVPPAQAVALSLLFVGLAVAGNLPGAILYATRGARATAT